ncbi:MAG: ATP-binding cassette domain-containing protein [Clostridia bacterium]|nr:ATP-binding cassette domain-containing protein [Clostridia bacterium]
MIKATHLTKRYGSFTAVDDISFTVGEGEIVGFLGPNGAGKSTTMNMLTGYVSATAGDIEIDGHDLLTDTAAAKKSIGYLPELPPVYPEMTVGEYLDFVYELKGCTLPRKQHLADVCEVTKTGDSLKRIIKNLSKGYRQRIGIAQALIGDPKTIILDEPTIGLDPRQIIEMRNLIRILGRDHAVILSTHILGEVQSVCDRLLIINRGRLVADEKTEVITTRLSGRLRVRATVAAPEKQLLSAVRAINGVLRADPVAGGEPGAVTLLIESEPGVDIRRPLFRVCAESGWPILALEQPGADLENVFISLTAKDPR